MKLAAAGKASGKSSIAAAHRVYSYSAFPLSGHVINPSRDAVTEEALEQTTDFDEKSSDFVPTRVFRNGAYRTYRLGVYHPAHQRIADERM
jgi:hypothetical protein